MIFFQVHFENNLFRNYHVYSFSFVRKMNIHNDLKKIIKKTIPTFV